MWKSCHTERIPCLLKNLERNNNQRQANYVVIMSCYSKHRFPASKSNYCISSCLVLSNCIANLRCDLAKGLCLRSFAKKLLSSVLIYISVCCPGEVMQQGLGKFFCNSSFRYLFLLCLFSCDRLSCRVVSSLYFMIFFPWFLLILSVWYFLSLCWINNLPCFIQTGIP